MSKRYDDARAAYEAEVRRVQDASGYHHSIQPYDFSGAFVFEEHAWKLLESPTKTEAAKIYEELLEYASYAGWDVRGRPFVLAPSER